MTTPKAPVAREPTAEHREAAWLFFYGELPGHGSDGDDWIRNGYSIDDARLERVAVWIALADTAQQALSSRSAPEQVPTGDWCAAADSVISEYENHETTGIHAAITRGLTAAYAKGLSDAAELRLGAWADSVLDWWSDSNPGFAFKTLSPAGSSCSEEWLCGVADTKKHRDLAQLGDTAPAARLAAARAIAALPGYSGPKEPGT